MPIPNRLILTLCKIVEHCDNDMVKRLMVVEIRDNFINAVSEGENDIRKHCFCLSIN